MDNNRTVIILIVIRLEKLKQKTWILFVFTRVLFFLAILVNCYLKRS
jgi:hypothetical protein